jgi:uncharacterized protein
MKISKKEARRIFLSRQGLLRSDHYGRGKNAVRKAIEQLSWLQIDTISVVQRAHHHVLGSRISNYDPQMLHKLQVEDRHLFEYWSHAAAYLPISDYRYFLPIMKGSAIKRPPDKKLAPEILKRIEAEGPLQSRDFESPRGKKSSGWWDWKPAKRALEQLYLAGELMVSHRDGFQKVYDLRERVLPPDLNVSEPTESQWCEFLVQRMVGALGLVTEYDAGYTRTAARQLADRKIKEPLRLALENLVESGKLIEVTVGELNYYTRPELLSESGARLGKRQIRFLSPFDNLIINRRRALELFDFDYQLECYVPAAKRRYGYFCLPILFGDELIGRMDAKAERKKNKLIIKNLHLDEHIKLNDQLKIALETGLTTFARSNNCDSISVEKSNPASLQSMATDLIC